MAFEPPLYMQNSALFEYSARQDRFLIDLFFAEGLLDAANTGATSGGTSTTALTVSVAPFAAVIDGDDIDRQGAYLVRMIEAETVTAAPPPASGSRLDLLVIEIIDGDAVALAGRPEGPRLRAISGAVVTTGSPVLPDLPKTALPLASWTVAAGATSIPTASITNRRIQSAVNPSFNVNLQVIIDDRFKQQLDAAKAVIDSTTAAANTNITNITNQARTDFAAAINSAAAPSQGLIESTTLGTTFLLMGA